jgi:hypothetical protein
MHRGLPCLGLCSSKLVACGPSGISCSTFSSFGMSHRCWVLHAMTMTYINKEGVIQVLTEIASRKKFLFFKIILLDRSENYESNGTNFIIFGALDI